MFSFFWRWFGGGGRGATYTVCVHGADRRVVAVNGASRQVIEVVGHLEGVGCR